MKLVCPQCGMVVKSWAKTCPRCGAELKRMAPVIKKGKKGERGGDPMKDRGRWSRC